MGNPVVQFQILSTAPDETAQFYSELFGWNIGAADSIGYRRIDTASNTGIQGGIWPADSPAPNLVQLFIAVDDLNSSVEKAHSLGARLLVAPTQLPQGDSMAVLLDPSGMPFGLYRKS
jgi:uncharacterized protein